jgi:hypothetical protein
MQHDPAPGDPLPPRLTSGPPTRTTATGPAAGRPRNRTHARRRRDLRPLR